jgi:hypothetical protein
MVRNSHKIWAACALALVAAVAGSKAQDVWGGGFPNDNINVASNWVGGVLPPGYTSGSDILEFNDSSGSDLRVNVASINFAGIQLTDNGNGVDANIYGTSALSIGGSGITLSPIDSDSADITISAPVTLTSTQTWNASTNGDFLISGLVTGTGPLLLSGGSGDYFEFDNGANSFSGGVTLTGAGSFLIPGASGTPFGTGTLSLGDGVTLQPPGGVAISLANNVTFGDGTGTGFVNLGGASFSGFNPTSITFTGNMTFNENLTANTDSELDLEPNTSVVFTGTLDGGVPGICLDLGTLGTGRGAVIDAQGVFGSNLSRVDLEDDISLILDGTPGPQTVHLSNIGTSTNTYLGLGASYIGSVGVFLAGSQINQSNFQGTLGFDNTSGGTSTFFDAIDMTGFNPDSGLVGLGSTSKAILTGMITPPLGLGQSTGTPYTFGGGGGHLQVTSALIDSTYMAADEPNPLWLAPGNAPLTLQLSGALSYSGGTYVDGAALVFDTHLPMTGLIYVGERKSTPGYVGVTTNSQFVFDGSGGAGTHPQDFIAMIDTNSSGVVGFEGGGTVSDPIDIHTLPNMYLGTSSSVTYSGAITPSGTTLMFAGVKGGAVTVNSISLQSGSMDSVVVGLPTPIESYGSVSSVTIAGANYYSGGTTLNSGYLYVSNFNSLGSGPVTVVGPTTGTDDVVGLVPTSGGASIPNNIVLQNNGTQFNKQGSSDLLTLTGVISSTIPGSIFVDGPVEFDGVNTFSGGVTVNGTTLTLGNNNAVSSASYLQAFTGSTINFTALANTPYVQDLSLTGSVVNYSPGSPLIGQLYMANGSQVNFAAGSTPTIDFLNSDSPTDGNTINLGTSAILTLNLVSDPDYHGQIVGMPASGIVLESGTLNLIGSNTSFNGTVTVQTNAELIASNNSALGLGPVTVQANGTLIANTGVTLSNALTFTDGGTLAGFGTFSPGAAISIQNGSFLIPGSATLTGETGPPSIPVQGTLAFGASTPLTFGTGGILKFSLVDANGAAGAGYSTVNANGGLNITATSGSPFDIQIYSFAPGTTAINATNAMNFSTSAGYSWTLVSSPTAITGFNANDFTFDTSNFFNGVGAGGFYVTDTGNDLVLNFSPVPEPSTWVLLGCGAATVGVLSWRRRKRFQAVDA